MIKLRALSMDAMDREAAKVIHAERHALGTEIQKLSDFKKVMTFPNIALELSTDSFYQHMAHTISLFLIHGQRPIQ